jgi:hypothetical protein
MLAMVVVLLRWLQGKELIVVWKADVLRSHWIPGKRELVETLDESVKVGSKGTYDEFFFGFIVFLLFFCDVPPGWAKSTPGPTDPWQAGACGDA